MSDNNDTLNWYKENANDFVKRTTGVDMSDLYRSFLKHIPTSGYIMDLGCGAGSAALYFTQKGYRVLAVDGCEELCDYTHLRAGCPVRAMRFEELDYEDSFDGVRSFRRRTGQPSSGGSGGGRGLRRRRTDSQGHSAHCLRQVGRDRI